MSEQQANSEFLEQERKKLGWKTRPAPHNYPPYTPVPEIDHTEFFERESVRWAELLDRLANN